MDHLTAPTAAQIRAAKRAANQEAHRTAQQQREAQRLQAREAFHRVVSSYLAGGFTPEQIAPMVKTCVCRVEDAIKAIKRQERRERKAARAELVAAEVQE